jgi:hypothetical protein
MKMFLMYLLITAGLMASELEKQCSDLGMDGLKPFVTLDETKDVDCRILQYYTQPLAKKNDPLADRALVCLAYNYPKKIIWRFTGKDMRNNEKVKKFFEKEQIAEKCAKYAFPKSHKMAINYIKPQKQWGDMENDIDFIRELDIEGLDHEAAVKGLIEKKYFLRSKKKPLHLKAFMAQMSQIFKKYELQFTPSYGNPYQWSYEFKEEFSKEYPFYVKRGRLLMALASGESIRFMKTGKESALHFKMMSYPEHSLLPHDVFEISYVLSKGNVYEALLTIQNLLSYHWQTRNRQRIDYLSRFIPITMQIGDREDVFGTWYHLFGAMLYSYATTRVEGTFIMGTEVVMSNLYDRLVQRKRPDKQENHINYQGVRLGVELRQAIKKNKWQFKYDDYTQMSYLKPFEMPRRKIKKILAPYIK